MALTTSYYKKVSISTYSCDFKTRNTIFKEKIFFNPQAPVAQKTADEVVFRDFRGEGVEFF